MLVLKLRRTGKKHQPSFRLVVAERRSKIAGKYVENLGWFDPRSKQRQLNKDRILYWLQHGAQQTDTVHNLLIKDNIIKGQKIAVCKKAKINKVEQSKDINQKEKNMKKEIKMQEELTPEMPGEETPEMPGEETPAPPSETPEAPEFPEVPAEEASPTEEPAPDTFEETPAEEETNY